MEVAPEGSARNAVVEPPATRPHGGVSKAPGSSPAAGEQPGEASASSDLAFPDKVTGTRKPQAATPRDSRRSAAPAAAPTSGDTAAADGDGGDGGTHVNGRGTTDVQPSRGKRASRTASQAENMAKGAVDGAAPADDNNDDDDDLPDVGASSAKVAKAEDGTARQAQRASPSAAGAVDHGASDDNDGDGDAQALEQEAEGDLDARLTAAVEKARAKANMEAGGSDGASSRASEDNASLASDNNLTEEEQRLIDSLSAPLQVRICLNTEKVSSRPRRQCCAGVARHWAGEGRAGLWRAPRRRC